MHLLIMVVFNILSAGSVWICDPALVMYLQMSEPLVELSQQQALCWHEFLKDSLASSNIFADEMIFLNMFSEISYYLMPLIMLVV